MKRPLIYPKINNARSVAATDTPNAIFVVGRRIYGTRGITPPRIYAPAIVPALITARVDSGFSNPNFSYRK